MRITVACLVGIGLWGEGLFGQEKEVDPFNHEYTLKDKMIDDAPETWEVMWEVFSVPFSDAAKLKRNQKDPGKIYEELVKRSGNGKAVLEEFVLLVGKIQNKSMTESNEEMIFPTEYEPPEIPLKIKNVPESPEVASFLITPATPTSFDTQKMGSDLKIEFEWKVTPDTIKVNLNFERAALLDFSNWGQGKSKTKMPEFAVQGINRTVFLKSGKPMMVGTMSPPKERPEKNGKRRVWFAFATTAPSGN